MQLKEISIFLLISTLFQALSINSKYVDGRVYLAPGRINEVTKFNFGIGTGLLNGTIEFFNQPKGTVYLFMDTHWWDKFHAAEDCDKVKHAHTHFNIGQVGNRINSGLGIAQGFEITETEKKKKRWRFTWTITHKVRTYGWYVVFADCSSEVTEDPKVVKRNRYHQRVNYELEFLNNGNDHLSADERWLTELYILSTVCLIAGWQYFSNLMRKQFGNGSVHFIIKLLRAAYLTQIIAMVFELIHQIPYRYNGSGLWIFDLFSEVTEGLSQTIISFVLLCLANGYTFFRKAESTKWEYSISEVMNDPSLIDIDNPVLFILVLFLFISMLLQVVNKLYDDTFMKFHDHETFAGFALLLLRFVIGILYFITFMNTIKSQTKRGAGHNLIAFMTKLMLWGGAWFLAFPLTVFIASFFAHYLRHFVVTSGVLVTQSVCLTLLSYEFISDKSSFARFSQVQQTGMLPGFSKNTYSKYV